MLHAIRDRLPPQEAVDLAAQLPMLVRGLFFEGWRLAGKPLSRLIAEGSSAEPPFQALRIALEPSDRAALHRRIDERFRAMLAAGLVAEVEALRTRYALNASLPSMRAVGYRQAWETLEGAEPVSTLADRGIAACIPSKKNRKQPIPYDKVLYRQRHRIEIMFGRIKDWRRIATRYDRCPIIFFGAITLAAIIIFWLNL